jgi:serine/threonine-protein kinase
MGPAPSMAVCALCRRDHDPERLCSQIAGGEIGRIGEVLAERYELLRLLGAGGMGAVYEARHTLVGRRFAVKLLHPQYARQSTMLTRFQREARAAGSLENEHIAAVTDFGFAGDGVPYLVLEYLEGQDLAALIARNGPMPIGRAVSFVIQACRGLAAAHANDIVHRDLKPANLFLTRRADGTDLVKVLDFGIAKLLDADDSAESITATGKLLGTACYMPPEQATGASDLDHRGDIYALGAILYELLTATKAHPGTNYNAVLFHILTQKCEPLGLRRPDAPPALARIIERAMAHERADRYQTVTTLLEALLPFTRGGGAETVAAPVWAAAGRAKIAAAETIASPASSPDVRGAQTARRPAGRRWYRRFAAAAAIAAIALAAGVGALRLFRSPAVPVRPPASLAPSRPSAPAPATPAALAAPAAAPAVVLPPAAPAATAPPETHPRRRRTHAEGARSRSPAGNEFDTRNPYDE